MHFVGAMVDDGSADRGPWIVVVEGAAMPVPEGRRRSRRSMRQHRRRIETDDVSWAGASSSSSGSPTPAFKASRQRAAAFDHGAELVGAMGLQRKPGFQRAKTSTIGAEIAGHRSRSGPLNVRPNEGPVRRGFAMFLAVGTIRKPASWTPDPIVESNGSVRLFQPAQTRRDDPAKNAQRARRHRHETTGLVRGKAHSAHESSMAPISTVPARPHQKTAQAVARSACAAPAPQHRYGQAGRSRSCTSRTPKPADPSPACGRVQLSTCKRSTVRASSDTGLPGVFAKRGRPRHREFAIRFASRAGDEVRWPPGSRTSAGSIRRSGVPPRSECGRGRRDWHSIRPPASRPACRLRFRRHAPIP